MKYIIMADGKGIRWANAQGIPKHLVKIDGEILLERTVRLIRMFDKGCEIIITSHDERYDIEGAERYAPKKNVLEIDRFTEELIENNVCFMYGDTYYSERAVETIVTEEKKDSALMFFGTPKSIVAVKVYDGQLFADHVNNVRKLYLENKIEKCIGWQVYASYIGSSYEGKKIGRDFLVLNDYTTDFNKYEEYEKTITELKK